MAKSEQAPPNQVMHCLSMSEICIHFATVTFTLNDIGVHNERANSTSMVRLCTANYTYGAIKLQGPLLAGQQHWHWY